LQSVAALDQCLKDKIGQNKGRNNLLGLFNVVILNDAFQIPKAKLLANSKRPNE